jgi:CDP-diacylglycerol--glycerol-3-phosphate 3-phosphatidyltransferase
MTTYALKPRFQGHLRPVAAMLPGIGVTANMVTVAAACGSILVGGLMASLAETRHVFLCLPAWLPVRMALNAVDGMLAREFGRKTTIGGYLNEIGDVVSDAALYAPLALVAPFSWPAIALLLILSLIAELAGALGPTLGAGRRYDGPMGKSDRAVVFGALGLWIGTSHALPASAVWGVPILAALLAATIANRVRGGILEVEKEAVRPC